MKWGNTAQSINVTDASFSYSSWEASVAASSVFIILTAGLGKEEEKSNARDQTKK